MPVIIDAAQRSRQKAVVTVAPFIKDMQRRSSLSGIKNFVVAIVLAIDAHCMNASAQSALAASSPEMPTAPTEEILMLRAQVSELRRFQEQIISTVYWSLGALGSVAVLLVGFGWWTNSRVYERDKESLERSLSAQLNDLITQAREEQRKSASESFAETKQHLDASAAAVETRLSAALLAHIEAAEKRLSVQVTQVKATSTTIGKQVRELRLAAQVQERAEARSRKSFRNALQGSVTALEIASELGDDYSVGEVLDLVSEDIRTILAGNDLPIDHFLIGQLVEALNAVKGTHAHAAAALRAQASGLATA